MADDNIVEVVIKGRDDTGAAFTGAAAQEKTFAKVVNDSYKTQEGYLRRVTDAERTHERATRLLADAEDVLGDHTESTGSWFDRLRNVLGNLTSSALPALGQGLLSMGSNLASADVAGAPLYVWALAIAPAILAVATALGPLVAGLGLVTVGFGAFALAAVPEIKKIMTALSATGPAAKKAWAALTPDARSVGRGIDSIKDSFGKISKAVQPEVLKAFATALGIIKQLLPTLTPLAVAAGKALDGFLKDIDNWLKSSSGKKFIEWMQTEGPKAIATFGHAMTDIVHGIGIVMYWWDRLGNDLDKFVKTEAPLVEHAFDAIVHAIGNVVHAVDNVVHAFDNIWHAGGNVVHAIDNVVNAVKTAVTWFGNLAGAANNALGGIPGKLLSSLGGALGFASGGVVGSAASGGPRSGWTLVGEMGPELVRIPPGSQVLNNPATAGLLGGSGGGNTYQISVNVAPGGNLADAGRQMVNAIREFERSSGTSWRAA